MKGGKGSVKICTDFWRIRRFLGQQQSPRHNQLDVTYDVMTIILEMGLVEHD